MKFEILEIRLTVFQIYCKILQLTFTCSKSKIETLEQGGVKYVQS